MCGPRCQSKDKRYCRVEKAIQKTIDDMYLADLFITKVTEFSKRAAINPASFYAHYPHMSAAILARDQDIRNDFALYLHEVITKSPDLETIFRRMFIFAYKNKSYFRGSIKRANVSAFREVTTIIKPLIISKWRKYRLWDPGRDRKLEEVFYEFSCELIREFIYWARNDNFTPETIPNHTKRLVYFAKTACQRLGRTVPSASI